MPEENENEKNELQKVETAEIQQAENASPLMTIISAASTDGGVDADKLMKLLEANERYEKNEARKAYHVAMSAFKKDPPVIVKDNHVNFKTNSGQTSYNHATLANVTSIINTALSEHGLSASWITAQENGVKVTCQITHILGHSESTSLTAAPDKSGKKNDIQAVGSTVSYLQRYTILALTGLATSEQDDDGAGSDKKDDFPRTTDAEQEVIEAIAEAMFDSAPDGIEVDAGKLGRFLYSIQSRYPDDMEKVNDSAGRIIKRLTDNNSWHCVNKEAGQ